MMPLWGWFGLGGLALTAALGWQTWQLDIRTHERDDARREVVTLKAAVKAEKDARVKDAAQAVSDYAAQADRCDKDFKLALASGQRIQTIVGRPAPSAGQPRVIVGASDLNAIAFGVTR